MNFASYGTNNVPAQVIQDGHVCIHVVEVVRVGRVLLLSPVCWQRTVQVEDMLFRFGLIVDTVKTHNLYVTAETRL